MVYAVDLVGQTMTPDPDRDISTGGGTRLRWGASLEVVGSGLALHCTERDYGDSCMINTFRAATALPARNAVRRAARARRSTKAARAKKGKARKSKRSRK